MLASAYALQQSGRSVLVLESRERVGGRLWTKAVDGVDLEIGGQWVSPDQDELLRMLDELGLETYSRYREGESIYIGIDGERRTFMGEQLPVLPQVEGEMARLAGRSACQLGREGAVSRGDFDPDPLEGVIDREPDGQRGNLNRQAAAGSMDPRHGCGTRAPMVQKGSVDPQRTGIGGPARHFAEHESHAGFGRRWRGPLLGWLIVPGRATASDESERERERDGAKTSPRNRGLVHHQTLQDGGAPGRIRTCAPASGGRCSIP